MKNLFLITCCMICFILSSHAQENTKKYKKEFPTQEMIERLSLKEDQIKELKKISEEYHKKSMEFRQNFSKSSGNQQGVREKMMNMRKEYHQSIQKVLDKDQLVIWEKMRAEKAERMKQMRKQHSR